MVPIVHLLAACTPDPGGHQPPLKGGPPAQPGPPGADPGGDDDDGEDQDDCVPTARVVINELSPSNFAALSDEDGETVDWIELFNAEQRPVDLTGWTLSDDKDDPDMWTFPPVTLDPGELMLVFASGKDRKSRVESWETRIDQGHEWRYLAVDGPTDPDWYQPGYDDSGWSTGPSGFGRGDADDATELNALTVYVRTEIELSAADLADLASLYLHVDYDDGFVAYLQGVEVARAGMGLAGTPTTWDQLASSTNEAHLYQGLPASAFRLTDVLHLLSEGSNTLALEVHQGDPASSDLTLLPFLSLGFRTDRGTQAASVLGLGPTHLHTNFSLAADGERVRLYDPAGCEADDLDPEPLLADQSHGRQPDGSDTLGYFLEPTPGAPNTTESRPGFAPTPIFDPPPGHYPGGTDVTVLADPNLEVHVAWEGFEPTEDHPLYDGPLETGDQGEAAVLRARAWGDGLWPSRIATATYLLREPGTLPIVSLTTDPPNLWDEDTGIYVFGNSWSSEQPYQGANFWEPWEKPVHVELWETDGTAGFAVDAGFAIHGGWSRAHEQKSFLVKMRSGYGDDELAYEVFPGLGLDEFGEILLRAHGTDWIGCSYSGCAGGSLLRDPLLHALGADEDLDVMPYRPAEVYLNGAYWGVYSIRERPSADWVIAHYGEEEIDLLETGGKVIQGDAEHFEATLDFLRDADPQDPSSYDHVQTLIDVDELAAYLAFEVFSGNTDWPQNNTKYWRPRTADGRWRWMLYDTDWGFGRFNALPSEDTLARLFDETGYNTELFRLMLGLPEFEALFVNTYADYLNSLFAADSIRPVLYDLQAEIAVEVPRHLERFGSWSDGTTTHTLEPGAWEEEIDWMDEWIGERVMWARSHLQSNLQLGPTWTLALEADPPGSGTFVLTSVEVGGPFTGEYFQGVPVVVTALPAAGFTFDGWSDPSLPNTPTIELDRGAADQTLIARFR